MSDFSFSIGALDADAKTVPVTFTIAGLAYSRSVNAAFRNDDYDSTETTFRVLDVGRGVLNKVSLGVLKDDATLEAERAGQGTLPLDGEVLEEA